MSTAAILGQYEAAQSTASTTSKTATDKDTFLKLLVAQLTHQDPLNPAEDKEFIAQLAQFTQVEELQNIRSTVESLGETMSAQQVTNAASLMGLYVSAKGDNIYLGTTAEGLSEASKIDINASTDEEKLNAGWKAIYFEPQQNIAQGTLNIIATDSNGNPNGKIIYSQQLAADTYKAGEQATLWWHGRDSSGNVMPSGSYVFSFVAADSDGKSVLVDSYSIGQIVGVESAADGNHKLTLSDGRSVEYLNIRQLIYLANSGSSTSSDNSSASAESGSESANTADSGTSADGSGTTTSP